MLDFFLHCKYCHLLFTLASFILKAQILFFSGFVYVRKLLQDTLHKNVEAWELVSPLLLQALIVVFMSDEFGWHFISGGAMMVPFFFRTSHCLTFLILYYDFQVSTNILRKYIGPVDIWLSILYAKFHPNRQVQILINEHPRKSYAAMAQHQSQWVWYVSL